MCRRGLEAGDPPAHTDEYVFSVAETERTPRTWRDPVQAVDRMNDTILLVTDRTL